MRLLLGTIFSLWLLAFVLPRIPIVQSYLGKHVSIALKEKLGTEVSIGNIELRLPSRIIVDDLNILDQSNEEMLKANRISVSIEILPLFSGQIRITSAQLFGMKAHLTQQNASSPLNCQFLIDSLKSKDTLSNTPLDLRISSLIIRNSAISYDRSDMPRSRNGFSPYHLDITDLSSHIILNQLTDDSLNLNLKRLHLTEKSGLHVKHLTFGLVAANNDFKLSNFILRLPDSEVNIPLAYFNYDTKEGKLSAFNHAIDIESSVALSDFAFLHKNIAGYETYKVKITSKGTEKICNTRFSIVSTGLNGSASATLHNILKEPTGEINVNNLQATSHFISALSNYGVNVPQQILALGNVNIKGKANLYATNHIKSDADIFTSKAGQATVNSEYNNNALTAHIVTPHINLAQIMGDKSLGSLSGDIHLNTQNINNLKQHTSLCGTVKEFTYNSYTYHNIKADGKLEDNILSGTVNINDPNIVLHANGTANIAKKNIIKADIDLQNFSASRLKLTEALGDSPLDAHLTVSPTSVELTSDIVDMTMEGSSINIATLPHSIMQIIATRLPSVPGMPKSLRNMQKYSDNDFTINMRLKDPATIKSFLPQSIEIPEVATLQGNINSGTSTANLTLAVPTLLVSGQKFNGIMLRFYTSDNTLHSQLTTDFMDQHGPVAISLNCEGRSDHLLSILSWDNQRNNTFKGTITTKTQFYSTPHGTAFSLTIPKSDFQVDDSLWTVQSNEIKYENGTIDVNNFYVGSQSQHVSIDGTASSTPSDSLTCQLANVDISYILNLVNFHSVEFDGMASGTFSAKGVLGDMTASGHLDVSHFLFEQGNLGTLHLDAAYSPQTNQIILNGICDDSPAEASTLLSGYVEPSPGAIYLDIQANNSRMEFVETFCSSFMHDCDMRGTGRVELYGPFSNINLKGTLVTEGAFTLTSTNCRYTMPHDTVTFVPDDILFHDALLTDKLGNKTTLTGGLHHKHLTQMSYDLYATTSRLLAYDFPTLKQDETFCGYAIINGDIGIHGKGNELIINADATPLPGTFLTYNASSPDAIRSGEIITWRSASDNSSELFANAHLSDAGTISTPFGEGMLDAGNSRTNIHMNFFVHANPEAKLHLIMDETTGDYVDLFGNGDLRVNYYNKGGLDIFGNYVTDHGLYKMTIQNLIRRDFTFRKGGTITFGGDPYDAMLNMQAQYSINSVPLADLNIGSTISANNIPVNCLMNITGTPGKPSVEFGLDLPSLSPDARQMVNSIINSEEEMNQQVLYLLAVGRFYAPSNVRQNENANNVSQGSLAVQSFLSGTISQQFNNVMSGVMSNLLGSKNTLTFGANIAPGNEGFSNAEYEGLLSGRLFNNRLLFNGQFGYRDNINTNSQSFIGDFDIQYLLTKSGTISLKAYNKTNDRYFTRNSLYTQGIGIVFQKEFGK